MTPYRSTVRCVGDYIVLLAQAEAIPERMIGFEGGRAALTNLSKY